MIFSDLKVKRIETTADTLTVEIMDGRVLTVPLAYYPTLLHATEARAEKLPAHRRGLRHRMAGTGLPLER